MPLGVGSQLLVAARTCYLIDRDNWITFEIFNNREGRRLGRWIPDGWTVAAVVLILFRQEYRYKQPAERTPRRMAIGCSDLFRVIVLHGVFVPGTAAVQRRNGCGLDAIRRRIRNSKNALGPLRAYTTLLSRTGSPVHLFLTWIRRHIPGVTVLQIPSEPLIPVYGLYETTVARNANEMTIMQLDHFDFYAGKHWHQYVVLYS